eukprot:90572-Rhodomonas_salina.3
MPGTDIACGATRGECGHMNEQVSSALCLGARALCLGARHKIPGTDIANGGNSDRTAGVQVAEGR